MKSLSTIILSSLLMGATYAKQEWDLDASHSSITFAIDHMVISETTGKFDKFSITAASDKEDFSDVDFKVEIETKSINTADAKRDEHLKNKDFFDVEKNPSITFVGEKFAKTKKGNYKVHGKLTMNGVTKPVVLDGKFNGIIKDPWGNTRAGLKVTGELDRYEYGLKYNSVLEAGGLAIGQKVKITANVELIKKQVAKK
jgi:polyisoprenoid-binding protein YceI